MLTRWVTIKNVYGIHCRPSTEIAKEVRQLDEEVTVGRENSDEVNAANVLQLVGLGLQQGDEVIVKVEGPQEEQAMERMQSIFEKEFEYVPGQ